MTNEYSKTCVERPSKKTIIGFQDRLSLSAGQTYCRMLKESILQYFQPSLSHNLSPRSFLSGLYCNNIFTCTLIFSLIRAYEYVFFCFVFFQMGSYKEAVCLVCFLGLVTMSYGARIVSHYKGRKLPLLCWCQKLITRTEEGVCKK